MTDDVYEMTDVELVSIPCERCDSPEILSPAFWPVDLENNELSNVVVLCPNHADAVQPNFQWESRPAVRWGDGIHSIYSAHDSRFETVFDEDGDGAF